MSVSSRYPGHPFWRGEPLVLASRSVGRARLLAAAGVPFVAVDSGLDERQFEKSLDATPADLALRLAIAKAQRASISYPNRNIVGADQVMALGNEILHKASDRAHAVAQLRRMRGRSHQLHSAIAVVRNGEPVFTHVSTASLDLRGLW